MADEPVDSLSPGWLGGLYRWLKGTSTPPGAPQGSAGDDARDRLPVANRALRDSPEARRRRDGRGVPGRRRAPEADRRVEDDAVARRTTRRRASGSGARPARRRASTIRTSARSTRSAKTMARCSSRWSCSKASRCSEHLKRGPLSVDQAVPIAVDMLAALGAIHARGIVHRDLKPSNVFLSQPRRQAPRFRAGATRAEDHAGYQSTA